MATLGRFGVNNSGMKQPKPKHRFRVSFRNIDDDSALQLETNTCGKPNMTYEEQTVHAYNSRAYYAGKYEWNSIEIVVRDTVDNLVSRAVDAQMRAQMEHTQQTSPVNAGSYKFTMEIETLTGTDQNVLDKWTLEGCWFQAVNYGDFDYSSSEASTITLTVRYDNAEYSETTSGASNLLEQ